MSAKQLADLLAMDRHTIVDAFVPAGCPVHQRADKAKGLTWLFRPALVVEWLVQGYKDQEAKAADFEFERAREKRAKADLAEMARDRMRGQLIEIAAVAAIITEEYARVRARLLSMPSSLAMLVQYESDLQALERLVKAAVSEALEELVADRREDWQSAAAESAAVDPEVVMLALAAPAPDDNEGEE